MALYYQIIYETDFLEELTDLGEKMTKEKLKKFISQLENKTSILQTFPRLYQKIELNIETKEEYRKIVLDKYIIIYKVNSNTIAFYRIFPQKENYIKRVR